MTQPPIEDADRTLPKLERPDVQVKLLEFVEKGHELSAAAVAVGIKPGTAQKWLFKGRDQRERGVLGKYRAFLEQYEFALMKPKSEIRESVLKEAKRNGWLGLEVLARWGDPDFQPVDVEQRVRVERLHVFAIIEEEFHGEPEVVARFYRALTRGRRGVALAPGGGAAPERLASTNEPRTVDAVPVASDAVVSGAEASAAAGDGTRSD